MTSRDENTPDGICRALGLPGFRSSFDPNGPRQELRILLCPAFDPAVCIAFAGDTDGTAVRVQCAATHLPAHKGPVAGLTADDGGRLAPAALADLEAAFRHALAEPDSLAIPLDGMKAHVDWRSAFSHLVVEGAHPTGGRALGAFLASAVERAYYAIGSPQCRNGLARVAPYVGLELPHGEPTGP